ncbi:cache domain-containing protein [Desulfovibrio mangrovi]|uniref:cache domain-containing protein n=1 Tax=Desulfovibrio mangrovi TaxID=2976983 RepID=UPI0022470CEA|nr:cache domain-containing protein [Desulfovibrio mangrovi]UZP66342.1 cache domain-containing protein [Desulfovibrio mangrovi]
MQNNVTIASRIGLLLLFMIVFASAIGVTYTYFMGKVESDAITEAKSAMMDGYERTLRQSVQSLAHVLGDAVREAKQAGQDPRLTLQEAIRGIRYEDSGYYFIYDEQGVNVAHPLHPEFQGSNRYEHEDPQGNAYIAALGEKAKNGGGFVTYLFNKPNEAIIAPKLAYAEMIPGTSFWLATGIYIDAIEAEQLRLSTRLDAHLRNAILTVSTGTILVLIIIVLPTSLVMVNSILKPWKQMEKELRHAQKMEAIGIFAGGIAHDFNNILGAITSCSELALSDTPTNSPVHEDLRHVLKAAKRGKNLVKRIKAFSRRTDAPRHAVNMQSVIKECMHLLQTFIPATIDVRVKINAHGAQVLADPDQLLQVVMNLCTNAEQAMRGMKGALSVTLDVEDLSVDRARALALPPGVYVRLVVSDTGVGMKPVVAKRIFEPFYTTRKKSGGTGLGLSMSHSIIKMHGGTITVQSVPGKGSNFTVYLPCTGISEERETHEEVAVLPRGTETILLVDDDEDLAYSVSKLFTRLGYDVVSKTSSPEALDYFASDPGGVDLMLTDHMMPTLTGVELTREIHKVRADLPVILYSGFEGSGLLPRIPKDWKTVGVSAFFTKPFETVELCSAVRRLLDEQKTVSVAVNDKAIDDDPSAHY